MLCLYIQILWRYYVAYVWGNFENIYSSEKLALASNIDINFQMPILFTFNKIIFRSRCQKRYFILCVFSWRKSAFIFHSPFCRDIYYSYSMPVLICRVHKATITIFTSRYTPSSDNRLLLIIHVRQLRLYTLLSHLFHSRLAYGNIYTHIPSALFVTHCYINLEFSSINLFPIYQFRTKLR